MDDITVAFISFIIGMVICFVMMHDSEANMYLKVQQIAISQCEENLPRDQRCEVVISAKVVDNE